MTNETSGSNGAQTPPEDLMRYDLLVETALRQVVQFALKRVEREGLPGEHHFYIAFDTRHPGVRLAERLRQKYPEEMTIVLQHQFWDLRVYGDRFEVGLSFGGIPEKLVIPFAAVTGFYDPHAQFALQFRTEEEQEEAEREVLALSRMDEQEAACDGSRKAAASEKKKGVAESGESGDDGGKTKVVSLDAFRKKT